MEIQEDSSYYGNIDISPFGYKMGEYHIDAHVIDGVGDQYKVAEAVGNVG